LLFLVEVFDDELPVEVSVSRALPCWIVKCLNSSDQVWYVAFVRVYISKCALPLRKTKPKVLVASISIFSHLTSIRLT